MATEPVSVRILDRDYRLACDPGERDALLAAAAHVDARMRDIREHGRVAGAERVAVLAALEIASEFLSGKPRGSTLPATDGSNHPSTPTPSHSPDLTPASATDQTVVVDSEMMRRMQSINALLDTAFVEQERLF